MGDYKFLLNFPLGFGFYGYKGNNPNIENENLFPTGFYPEIELLPSVVHCTSSKDRRVLGIFPAYYKASYGHSTIVGKFCLCYSVDMDDTMIPEMGLYIVLMEYGETYKSEWLPHAMVGLEIVTQEDLTSRKVILY